MVSTRAKDQPQTEKLKFNDKLLGSQTNEVLLKKLKVLQEELASFDQELVERDTLGSVRKQLIHKTLFLHKDRGVKAYVACCIADLLRLYAPDAPYTQDELRDIFQFFFKQLSLGLQGTSAPYYTEYYHLLESLSTVKSVVLVCDLPSTEELMAEIFKTLFSVVRRNLPKKLEMFMADILVALIDEAPSVPTRVIEILLAQFTDQELSLDQPAYRLALLVCTNTADRLQRPISQFFSDAVVGSQDSAGDTDESTLQNAHNLLPRLLVASTDIVASVMPQLEEELKVEDVTVRSIATSTLGTMFQATKHGPELARQHPSTWNSWIGRRNDRDRDVRLRFVESARGLIGMTKLPPYAGPSASDDATANNPIEASLSLKLLDPDEKVRAAVCRIYGTMDYETILHHVGLPMLKGILGRGIDKKNPVRLEGLKTIGRIYALAYPEIEAGTAAALSHFSWIPNELLHLVAVSGEVKAAIEDVLFTYIFPLPTLDSSGAVDEVVWTDRLLNVMKYLDDRSQKSLINLSGLRTVRPSLYEHFLESCVKYNGGVIDEDAATVTSRLSGVIKRLSMQFSDPQKAAEDLHTFAKNNESRLYKLFKTCVDVSSDVRSIAKAAKEFSKRVDQSIAPTLLPLLRRSTLWLLNTSSIPTLLRRIQGISPWGDSATNEFTQTQSQGALRDIQGNGRRQSNAVRSHTALASNNAVILLKVVSKHCPELFKAHSKELLRGISRPDHHTHDDGDDAEGSDEEDEDSKTDATQEGDTSFKDVTKEVYLCAVSALMRYDTDSALTMCDRKIVHRMMKMSLSDNNRQAKFAARIVAFSQGKSDNCVELVEDISNDLGKTSPDLLAAHVTVLVQMARYAPDALEHRSEAIISFLIKDLLLVPTPVDEDQMEVDEEWMPEEEVNGTTIAKVQALKLCRYRCLAHTKSSTALTLASPVLKLFTSTLANDGNITGQNEEDPKVMSRLRLQGAISLIHLSTVDKLAKEVLPHFVRLALTVQDTCFNVRQFFLVKLIGLLAARKLPTWYNIIPFLTVHDPENEIKSLASTYVATAFRGMPPGMKIDHFEIIFIRLLHLLAHHPDFGEGHEELVDLSQYVDFYLDLIASSETVSLIYHLAMRAKTVQDSEGEHFSRNLYVIGELAQELIKKRAAAHSWSLQSYPGKVKLPSDVLRPFRNAEAANKVAKTVYLPQETLGWLEENEKERTNKERKEKRAAVSSKRKNNGAAKRTRRKKRRKNDDDDGSEHYAGTSDAAEEDTDADPRAGQSSDAADEDDNSDSELSSDGEEQLGRGARSRAKEKQRRKTKKLKKAALQRRETSPLTSASEGTGEG